MSTFSSNMVTRMENDDHDLRYMAVSDLKRELESDGFPCRPSDASHLVNGTVRLLGDSSRDVRALAVDVFPLLVKVYGTNAVRSLIPALTSNMLSEKEELRDVSAMGLSVIVTELAIDSPDATLVCELAIGPLVQGLRSSNSDVNIRALEVTSAVLAKFCARVVDAHKVLLDALLSLTDATRETVRKHTVTSIGYLTASLSPDLFSHLFDYLVDTLADNGASGTKRKTLVACLAAVTDTVGPRVAQRLGDIIQLSKRLVVDPVGRDHDMLAVEVTDAVIRLYTALVRRCPAAVAIHLDTIIEACVAFIAFDPNYQDDDDDDENPSDEDSDYDEYDEYDDDDMSDDEDISWKVRKASAKCLAAMVETRPSMLPHFYSVICPVLVKRFKERQDAVKADVFAAFVTLVKTTANVSQRGASSSDSASLSLLVAALPAVAKSLAPQLTKSPRAREAAVAVVLQLATVLPNELESTLPLFVPRLVKVLNEADADANALRVDVCTVLRSLLANAGPTAFVPFRAHLIAAILPLLSDSNFKIISGGLQVLELLVAVLAADPPAADNLEAVLDGTIAALKGESDRHVKTHGLAALGATVAAAAHTLGSSRVGDALPLFVASVQNALLDVRVAAVSALGTVFSAPAAAGVFDVSAAASVLQDELTGFLRKSDRALVAAALTTTKAMVAFAPATFNDSTVVALGTEAAALVSEADLGLATLAADLLVALVDGASAQVAAQLYRLVSQPVMALLSTAVVQGASLQVLVQLLEAAVAKSAVGVDAVVDALVACGTDGDSPLPRQAYTSLATAIAGVLNAAAAIESHLAQFATVAGDGNGSEASRVLALYVLGQIGVRHSTASAKDELARAAMSVFDAESERIKAAGAYALGKLAVSAPDAYLPRMFEVMDGASGQTQFLVLTAFKEFVDTALKIPSSNALAGVKTSLWPVLVASAASDEVGTRNVASECLGLLVASNMADMAPALAELVASEQAHVRGGAVSALKSVLAASGADAALAPFLPTFFALIADPSVEVRRLAVKTFTFFINRAPALVCDLVPDLLPQLYDELPVKKELIRELKLGIMTVKVDDAELNRKAALECFHVLVLVALDKINVHELVPKLMAGFGDRLTDNAILCHTILTELASLVPAALLEVVDALIKAFTKTLKDRPWSKAAKDVDAFAALINATLRTIHTLHPLALAADSSGKWRAFEASVAAGKWASQYAVVCGREVEAPAGASG
ncbi:Cullin-associated NEDD8-dissociated protein 2 [Thecamonas trahens ATCC 50062]|uniref:Cullin-associated NEDD8-dissociated protein 2 n=1 Tax=Thecamonas trahens ATCC 50062 TaxID=461836 RepID=A0A0L0D690_THETB|nr:Cullin-associated NEDD8-dissociated protein 2 [Thecamonas trahens ATCC 50062]KNC47907.1 Cullin-associated NEDD8-dissociated protein 2 [Thecamonas trahens ATCC 50062]|eukprot:XP_013758929.1 Cullin-associated NEDD8-dissociated protein 2 [Thecamonas trahens ATCC 50062]